MITYKNASQFPRKFPLKALSAAIVMALGSGMVYAQPNSSSDESELTEEIVVYGIRHSLQSAAQFKRDSSVVVDSITAEDIGKFPDANVADSLQRVTGVQISRDRGGEGRFVSVRGLGSQFNLTTMNGRALATDNAGRDFSFDIMPSELISQADVYKTSAASLDEGSIGGMISVKTRKPLDTPGLQLVGSIGGQYDDGTEEWGEQTSLVASNSFMDDTLGVSFGVTYSKRDWEANTYELLSARKVATFEIEPGEEVKAWMPDIPSFQYKFGERERLGAAGAIQFRPNDNIDSTIDFFYSNYKTPEGSYSFNINFGSSLAGTTVIQEVAPWSTPVNTDSQQIDYVVTKFSTVTDLEMGTDTRERETDTYMIGWNTVFQATDDLELTFDVAYSEADRPNEGDDLYTVAGMSKALNGEPQVSYVWDTTRSGPPNLQCTLADGRACWDITNDDIGLHYMDLKGEQVNDKVTSLHFDGDYSFEFMDLATELEFGLAYSSQEKDKEIYKTTDGCTYCGFDRKVSAAGVNVIEGYLDYDTGVDTGINHWPVINPYELFAAARAFDVIEGQPGRFDERAAPKLLPMQSTLIEEENLAAYLQANMKGEAWDANAGVRWVQTDLTSNGHVTNITKMVAQSSSNYLIEYAHNQPVAIENDYDILLPSATINWNFLENAKLRFAASQTMTRPTFTQLGPDLKWEAGSGFPKLTTGGNPELEPIKSDNFDLSLEWYDEGMSASLAVYHKDITDWIFWGSKEFIYTIPEFQEYQQQPETNSTQTFNAATPLNGDEATLDGVEVAFQQVFDNGFGFQVNYTFADTSSTTTVNGITVEGELDGVSENTYNLMGFYENDIFSARLSYTYRDEFVADARGGEWGNPKLNVDYEALDLSLGYNINDNFSIYLEAQNLLEGKGHTYWGDASATHYYEQYYRRFEIGARFKF